MRAEAVYRALLFCYPEPFRNEYGGEMLAAFSDQLRDLRRRGNLAGEAAVWFRTALDVLTVAPKEHLHMIGQDVRYALRTLAANPGFAAVAVLSLALGIGANTAIFSLLNGILLRALPVLEPERLVLLSDPDSAGVAIGSQQGERSMLTYAEFAQLERQAGVFSGIAAAQSALGRWQVRVDGAEAEPLRGRLVSSDYFRVLGAPARLGRVFTRADGDAPGSPALAVISHDFWKRRFGGRHDVLGRTLRLHRTSLTIIGVTRPGFFGETVGQRPDFWAPLTMQPAIIPGRDWLHDQGIEKVMWLHVLARLTPGVSVQQAQDRANAVFHRGLEEFAGNQLSAATRKEFLDQKLRIRPAATGVSTLRERFSEPLYVLLGVVGVVLLIACANVANLLLARGAVRQREIAVRLSLGATRGRLIRQLLTESLVLALAGGLAGLAAGYGLQRGMVVLFAQSVPTFQMGFGLDGRLLAFSFAVTLAGAAAFGLLPALRGSRADLSAGIKEQGRSNTAGGGQLRWGRALVVVQIALSVPLLVGAGLLLRTLHNLQQADLGYPKDQLLLLRVEAQSAGYGVEQRAALFQELLGEIRRVPGVRAASFSENGLFASRDSGDQISVEGYTPKGDDDRGARWDQLGPGYFSTLGVPMLLGREITEQDQAGSARVCVINEAFRDKFFAGRNPIGLRITTEYGDRKLVHQVAGVARNHRTHRLRDKVDPRYFVPLAQPLGEADSVIFEVRTAGDPAQWVGALRRVVLGRDQNLQIERAAPLAESVGERMATERLVARLSLVFGVVALLLAAVGLYGVLSYGVARRRGEIGVRIALGANPGRVVGMVLSETGTMLAAGLALGVVLAFASVRLISSQLFGLAPTDPATFAVAVAVLALVAAAAAYLPAHRASRVDPVVALRTE